MWIELSDSLYLFGAGGITRIEAMDIYMTDGSKSDYKTALYCGQTKITMVMESVKDIKALLDELNSAY